MQLLIDTAVENSGSLRFAASTLLHIAAMMDAAPASINGDEQQPIRLFDHIHQQPTHGTVTEAASKGRPTPPPVGPAPAPSAPHPLPPGNIPPPPVVHPERHPDAPPPPAPAPEVPLEQQDPAKVFGGLVPAGTNPNPPAPPAPSTATAPATVSSVAPVAGNAPTSAPTGTAAASADVVSSDRDSEYIPWDARIHSETRKKNADGTWRYRRNLDPNVKAQVYAELKAAHGQQVPLPQPPAGVAGSVPVPPSAPPVPGQPAATNPVLAPPQPDTGAVPAPPVTLQQPSNVVPIGTTPVPVPPTPGVGVPNAPQPGMVPVTGFRELMTKVNRVLAAGTLTQDQLTAACKAAGVESGSITALASQASLVPAVDAELNRLLGAAA